MSRRVGSIAGIATGVALAALSASCQAVVYAPPATDAAAILYLFEEDGGAISALLAEPGSWQSIDFASTAARGRPAYALIYRCPLAGYGLTPGIQAVERGTAVASGRGPVPEPHAIFRATLSEGDEWEALASLPEALGPLTIARRGFEPPRPSCKFSQRVFSLDPHTERREPPDGHLAVALPGERVLVATQYIDKVLRRAFTDFHLVTADGPRPLPELGDSLPGVGGFASTAGDLWLVGHDGRVVRGRLDTADRGPYVVETSSVPTRGPMSRAALDGPRDPNEPFELFAITEHGVSSRFDGARWHEIDNPEEQGLSRQGGAGSLVRLGPGEAIFAGAREVVLLHYSTTTASASNEPFRSDNNPNARNNGRTLLRVPGIGVVLGTVEGQFYSRPIDRAIWTQLPPSPMAGTAISMALYGKGFIAGSYNGRITVYDPDFGFTCTGNYGGGRVAAFAALGDGLVLLTNKEIELGGGALLTILDPVAAEPNACTETR